MVPGGRTPIVTNERANEIGFRLVIWPTLALEAVVPAVEKALQSLKKTGKTPEDQSMGPGALFEVCGLRDLVSKLMGVTLGRCAPQVKSWSHRDPCGHVVLRQLLTLTPIAFRWPSTRAWEARLTVAAERCPTRCIVVQRTLSPRSRAVLQQCDFISPLTFTCSTPSSFCALIRRICIQHSLAGHSLERGVVKTAVLLLP